MFQLLLSITLLLLPHLILTLQQLIFLGAVLSLQRFHGGTESGSRERADSQSEEAGATGGGPGYF